MDQKTLNVERGTLNPRRRAPRPTCDVDPLLLVTIHELAAKHGKAAVLAAAQAVGRREQFELSREQKERVAALIDALPQYSADVFNPFAFLQRQKAAGIPAAISIEILEIVVKRRPDRPWALISTVMHQDYPNYSWGRG